MEKTRRMTFYRPTYPQYPNCLRVQTNFDDRSKAIQELVRPHEVAHLINIVPRAWLPRNFSSAKNVSNWFKMNFSSRQLNYVKDQDGHDTWCSPLHTLQRKGGDCDDLSILGASIFKKMGVEAVVIAGTYLKWFKREGHAWVEGLDEHGWFLLEATNGTLYRENRPIQYHGTQVLHPQNGKY